MEQPRDITALSPEAIRNARSRAVEIGDEVLREKYKIDWSRTNSDKRKGTVRAWSETGLFLGEFKSHTIAISQGAAVTLFSSQWFLWSGSVQ